jgi:hypothetical protein
MGDDLPVLKNLDELQAEHEMLLPATGLKNWTPPTFPESYFMSTNAFDATRLPNPHAWNELQWANC